MEDFKNKYGTLNPMRINEYIQLKSELLNEYSKVETLESFKEFLTKNKEVTKEIIKEQSIPMNKEIIDYAFVQDNCVYNNKIIKDVIKYANDNKDFDLLNVIKERHQENLKNPNNLIGFDNELIKYYSDNNLLELNDGTKKIITTKLVNGNEFEKLELLSGCKEYILENSNILDVEGTKNLINHYNLDNEKIKKIFLSSLDKKGNCEEESINVFVNNPTNQKQSKEDLESGGFGEHLLTDKVKYFIENYQFDKKTLKEAFDICVNNQNLETAKYLLDNNDFEPQIATVWKIKDKYPRLSEYCKKLQLKKDLENKYSHKSNINNDYLKL